MMHRPGGKEAWTSVSAGNEDRKRDMNSSEERQESNKTEKERIRILTGKELKDARDGEPLSFAEGEELSHKHKDAQDGEYTSKHGAGLHCLEVICRGRQREGNTMKLQVCRYVCHLKYVLNITLTHPGNSHAEVTLCFRKIWFKHSF